MPQKPLSLQRSPSTHDKRTGIRPACTFALALLTLLGLPSAFLTGCGSGTSVAPTVPIVPATGAQGRVLASQQSVSGATIALYAAGRTGNGNSATSLLPANSTRTDANGYFTITGDYTCPSSSSQIYIVARGGNPGLATGTSNAAIVLMAALGDCGSLSSFNLINITEATTVASAWALSQFIGAGAIVGSASTNATGLRNAFLTAATLANPLTGTAPGTMLPQAAVLETAKLNTLANAVAACAHSDGLSACTPLFAAAGVSTAASPTTLDAALNVVRRPAANVSALFSAASSAGPFQPVLSAAPNDWTLSLTLNGSGLNQPGDLAIDSSGSVWIANYFGAVVSKFLATGVAPSATGYPGIGLHQSFGVAVDPQDNVWISNETSVAGANNARFGSLSKFSNSGAELSSFGYTAGGLYYPQGIASDPAGNIWVANYGNSSASLLANNGTAISPAAGFGPSALAFTSAVAVDSSRNGWFAVQQAVARVTPTGAVSTFPCCNIPAGIAIDPSGNLWAADYGAASIVELTPAGTVAASFPSPGGRLAAQGIAVDSSGTVWAANFRGNSITQISHQSSGSPSIQLSPATGLGLDAQLSEPLGLAIDASGNLWTSNAGSNTVTALIGLAAPVRTPLQGPPTAP